MPTYDYVCDECDHTIVDLYQSFNDEPLSQCPACSKLSLRRVIYGGIATFVKGVKTIGQLADKNWKDMGRYKRSEIEQKRKENNTESPVSPLGPASRKQISKMSVEQKHKYIMTGET